MQIQCQVCEDRATYELHVQGEQTHIEKITHCLLGMW